MGLTPIHAQRTSYLCVRSVICGRMVGIVSAIAVPGANTEFPDQVTRTHQVGSVSALSTPRPKGWAACRQTAPARYGEC